LIYRILDADGNKIGVPIKASSINCKPTLNNLEKKFSENGVSKEAFKQLTKNKLDDCFEKSPGTINDLIEALHQKNIYTVLRRNNEGRLYGITFVDNQNKCVFNGSDLGKGYSAAAIQSRLTAKENILTKDKEGGSTQAGEIQKDIGLQKEQEKKLDTTLRNESLIDLLLSAKEQFGNTPFQLLKKKKKKRRKNTST
jgi:hypothetical protein